MHQYELMRMIARMAQVLAEVARTPEATKLAAEAMATAVKWDDEEREYVDAVTRHADGE